MKRWFRFSLRSQEADGQAAMKVEDAPSAESDGSTIADAESSIASDVLAAQLSAGSPTDVEITSIEESTSEPASTDSAPSNPSIPDALDELFPNERGFDVRVQDEVPGGWGALPEDLTRVLRAKEPVILATELPSAAHLLAELFPVEAPPEPESAAQSIPESDDAGVTEEIAAAASTEELAAPTEEWEDVEVCSADPVAAIVAGVDETEVPAENLESAAPTASEAQEPDPTPEEALRPPYRDWAFEEKLASHREWVESHGVTGTKADFAGADLEGTELIGVNFRFANFHDANLKAADLLLADLRDACLVRADLQDACLVGANLEGVNLEGASLETALGLVPRQIAGANLRDASLPPSFLEFPAAAELERASQSAFRFFAAMLSASAICWLILWKTKDIQLLTDSAIIPFLHSHAAAAALPTVESYLILPVALFILYLVFQFHLQRVWNAALELPAIFPDGHALDDRGPGIVLGLLRAHFRWIEQDASSPRLVEKGISVFLAYWTVPITLLLFWARYLTRQEMRGTILHALLAAIATGIAFHATLKTGRPPERWALGRKRMQRLVASVRAINPGTVALGLGAVLLFLSVGTITGVPHDRSRAPQYGAANIRRWAPTVLWSIGFDPYAELTEASISPRPSTGTVADDQVASIAGPRLNNTKFRYAQAYGAFLANAHLWRADFEGAFLSDADLRGADLGQSNFQFALMDSARLNRANLDRATLGGADLRRADLREANLSHSWLVNATLVDAQLEGASLYGARLSLATLTRANFGRADLRESYLDGADLEHADFHGAYLWSARLPGANLRNAQLANAILIDADLRDTDLRWAQFPGTVLNGTNLTGASLDGADLRGALGLSANQVCSAKSHKDALLDDGLAMQVQGQCP